MLHGRFPYLDYPRRYTKQDRDIAYAAMERSGVAHRAQDPLRSLSGGISVSLPKIRVNDALLAKIADRLLTFSREITKEIY